LCGLQRLRCGAEDRAKPLQVHAARLLSARRSCSKTNIVMILKEKKRIEKKRQEKEKKRSKYRK
jgi:hypothetical protein